jgi:hypothetical protein
MENDAMTTFRRLGACFCLVVVMSALGCATAGKEHGERVLIAELMGQWKDAFIANDIDRLMALCSDSFGAEGKDKAAAVDELKEMMKEGAANDVRINIADATVTITGDTATAVPVAVCGRTGSDTIRLNFAKENGRWLVAGMATK